MDWQSHWRGREQYVVFDAAYGEGATFQALRRAWRDDPQRPARLHYIGLTDQGLPGMRRIPHPQAAVTLDLIHAPLDLALERLVARLDAVLLHALDGQGTRFAHALGKLANPGALLQADQLTQTQSAALEHAGFAWELPQGQARGRAVFVSRRPQRAAARLRERRAIVLGAGLAGTAACERLCARGWQVTLVERHAQPAQEASGNLAGICMPLLARDDNIMARLSRAAYLYANDYWDRLGGVGTAIVGARCGVLQLARDAAHAEVQRAIAASAGYATRYPKDFAEWLDSAAASALLGSAAPHGAWLFRQGGWLRPSSACGAMLTACGAALERRFNVGSVRASHSAGQWTLHGADGVPIAQAPVLVLANGNGARELAQSASLPLAALRGQVTYLAAGAVPELPFVLCREAYLTPAIRGIHSLGASYDSDADPSLRQASQDENLDKIRALLGDQAVGAGAPLQGRVGFRCVAPDRLPLVGALPEPDAGGRIERLRDVARQDGLYGLLGYASRGLAWAPLAAELLAAELDGEVLPLESDLVEALDPARFLLRERRRGTVARHENL